MFCQNDIRSCLLRTPQSIFKWLNVWVISQSKSINRKVRLVLLLLFVTYTSHKISLWYLLYLHIECEWNWRYGNPSLPIYSWYESLQNKYKLFHRIMLDSSNIDNYYKWRYLFNHHLIEIIIWLWKIELPFSNDIPLEFCWQYTV